VLGLEKKLMKKFAPSGKGGSATNQSEVSEKPE
jgi:hypothetical protein